MSNIKTISATILFILYLFSNWQVHAQADITIGQDGIKKEIEINHINYFKALSEKDTTLLQSLYTDDCWIMVSGEPILCGPKAAHNLFIAACNITHLHDGKFITIDLYRLSDNLAAEVGFYQLYDAANLQFDNGKYITLWKKTGSSWKKFRESFNSSNNLK